jgi:hypothetical protein
VQVHAGNVQLLHGARLFDQVKYAANAWRVLGIDPARVILLEESFDTFVSETLSHGASVILVNALCNSIDYIAKRSSRLPARLNYLCAGPLGAPHRHGAKKGRLRDGDRAKLVLRPKQEQLLQLLRARGGLSPREIWDGIAISKQGAMDLLRPLLDAGLIERVGTLKHGRYLLK